jgi:hypothetical protein
MCLLASGITFMTVIFESLPANLTTPKGVTFGVPRTSPLTFLQMDSLTPAASDETGAQLPLDVRTFRPCHSLEVKGCVDLGDGGLA